MPSFEVTPELIAGLAGVVLSLIFSYIPKLNEKFAALGPEVKRLIMLGLLLVVSAGIYGGTCGGIIQSGISCDKSGLLHLVWMFVTATIANQSTYNISPQSQAVRQASDEARAAMYRSTGQYLGGD